MELTTVIGFFAGLCTTLSMLPQLIKTIRTKSTKDLSLGMIGILTLGLLLWFIYGLLLKEIPIIVANVISFALAIILLAFKLKFK